jgi:L-amino acid N-acyltransferase YncA
MLGRISELAERPNQPFWAIRPASSGKAEGWLSLCDIYPEDGAIEIGAIWFAPTLQRTRAATEAVFLLMLHAMDKLGYQRLVWRCFTSNHASMKAAARFGFTFEGIWRGSAFARGRRWDEAWHSILAQEWPARRAAIMPGWRTKISMSKGAHARAFGGRRSSSSNERLLRNGRSRNCLQSNDVCGEHEPSAREGLRGRSDISALPAPSPPTATIDSAIKKAPKTLRSDCTVVLA